MNPAASDLPKVLCVDDEPQVLAGLTLHLRQGYQVWRMASAIAGLDALRSQGPFAVVISDMRMPGMDGAAFLARAREIAPDTTRLLLTGYADVDSALAAVNRGQIFRFLTKPCPPDVLRSSVQAAYEQFKLVTAQRDLLERTLVGAIRTLSDILALSAPLVYGRAARIRDLSLQLAEKLGLPKPQWALETAALLSQLAALTLPADAAERLCSGQEPAPGDLPMLERLPETTFNLLAHIPRLDQVLELLDRCNLLARPKDAPPFPSPGLVFEASVLRAAADYEALDAKGVPPGLAIGTLRGRSGRYDPRVLAALEQLRNDGGAVQDVRELPLRLLSAGMILLDDVMNHQGMLLIARGTAVSPSFLERARNMSPGTVKEPIRVLLPPAP